MKQVSLRPLARARDLRGMSLIDTLVGISIMLIVFLSIFGVYILATDLVLASKARTGALSLVSQQLEYVRGLPYETIGTVGGIPSGAIPQTQTKTLNNIVYTVRTLAKYVDDPADGLDSLDSNGITADYKEIKVDVSWQTRTSVRTSYALTRVSPHGIESLTSGGTLRINVFDALAEPIQNVTVRIENSSINPAVDLTLFTDQSGSIALPGTPPASNYEITVSKDGYSSAGTYAVTQENPNPSPGHVSVANQQSTTASFAIDQYGSLAVSTFSPAGTGTFSDSFTDETKLMATTSVEATGGALSLVTDAGEYVALGTAASILIQPQALQQWGTVEWLFDTPANTGVVVQVQHLSGSDYALIPDTDLAGNESGFQSGSVSLAALSPTTYPSLRLLARLTTSDPLVTPLLNSWGVGYSTGPAPLGNVDFTLEGTKTIGTTNAGVPISKILIDESTNTSGQVLIDTLEWDSYTIVPDSAYDVVEQCPDPLSVDPAQNQSVSLILDDATPHSLRVVVFGSGTVLAGASVTIDGPDDASGQTSTCGQSYFGGITSGTYTLTVTATGFQPSTESISVAGQTVVSVFLTP